MKLMSMPMLLALALLAAYSSPARADEQFDKAHPRRAEVNHRLKNQNKRVKEGVKDGSLTKQQAHQIKKEDRRIHKEEKHMAAKDGGHLTKADQEKLNRQENHVSKQINHDETKNAAPGQSGQPAVSGQPGQAGQPGQ